jgi:hypothetical protein
MKIGAVILLSDTMNFIGMVNDVSVLHVLPVARILGLQKLHFALSAAIALAQNSRAFLCLNHCGIEVRGLQLSNSRAEAKSLLMKTQ